MNNINPMTEVAMILPEGTPIPNLALPAGYSVRKYKSADDRATWARIVRSAEKHHAVIDENLHRAQFGEDEKIISQRQLFLVAPDGTDIGTATAWFDVNYNGQEWGRFHWLSIVPEYQGRGLAKPFVAITLKLLRKLGHQRIRLTTELVRTNAINIYLKFGFVPDMSYPNAKPAWEAFENKKFN